MAYERARIGVNAVIFTIHENQLKVLLCLREKDPFKERLELPGGLLETDEVAEQTLQRKLKEMIGRTDIFSQQYFTFTALHRDPRERTIAIGYISLISVDKLANLDRWYDSNSLKDLAFDHLEIIKMAREYLKYNLNTLVAKQFLPKFFPLNQLQSVYEIIEDKRYDNRNFRKKMISSGLVKETNKKEGIVSHRPAKLFQFKGLN